MVQLTIAPVNYKKTSSFRLFFIGKSKPRFVFTEEGGGGGKSEKGGKGGGGAVAGGGGGARKTGPVESIPETFEDWSLYEMPENIRQLCQEDMSGFCINKLTLNKPVSNMLTSITFFYDHSFLPGIVFKRSLSNEART